VNNASIFNLFFIYTGKNDFAKVSKNLAGYTDLKLILDHQNNYVH